MGEEAAALHGAPTVEHVLHVGGGDTPLRLDRYLVKRGLRLSRALLQRLIRDGAVTVNGQAARPSHKVHPHDRVIVRLPPRPAHPEAPGIVAEPIPLEIVYEDDALLVINKPAGLVVHPAPGHRSGTLVNALRHHLKDWPLSETTDAPGQPDRPDRTDRPGIVHRLDKDTSGLLVAAKTAAAQQGLVRQFAAHTIRRRYLALVQGDLSARRGTIDLPIGRDLWDRKRFSARTTSPKAAVTTYRVVRRFGPATLVEVQPQTGRTHQIRVHFAALRHPVVGDTVYSRRKANRGGEVTAARQMLHAAALEFTHPATRETVEFTAPLPADFQALLDQLERSEANRGR